MVTDGGCGRVHSGDLSVGVDGPDTRFVQFLAGCPLRCLYCHSPDMWPMRDGRLSTVDEVMSEVDRYTRLIRAAGGGFTVSGGEPLLQPGTQPPDGALLDRVRDQFARQGLAVT